MANIVSIFRNLKKYTGMRDGYDNTFDCHCEGDVFNVSICLHCSSYGIYIPRKDVQVI